MFAIYSFSVSIPSQVPIWFFLSVLWRGQGAHLLLSVRALARDRHRDAFSFHLDVIPPVQDGSSRNNSDMVNNTSDGHRSSPTEAHELIWRPATSRQNKNARRSEADATTRPNGVTSWMDEWDAEWILLCRYSFPSSWTAHSSLSVYTLCSRVIFPFHSFFWLDCWLLCVDVR